jgi:hypothetical protein
MPIRAYLDGHKKLDDEAIRRMGIAFETALASLGGTRGYDDPVRAALARSIIALAQAGEHDPERLCDGPCGRSALLIHPTVGRAAQAPKADRRSAAAPSKQMILLCNQIIYAAIPGSFPVRKSPKGNDLAGQPVTANSITAAPRAGRAASSCWVNRWVGSAEDARGHRVR